MVESWLPSPSWRQIGTTADLHGEAARRASHMNVVSARARRADEGMKCPLITNSTSESLPFPHPSLRATFSQREKGKTE